MFAWNHAHVTTRAVGFGVSLSFRLLLKKQTADHTQRLSLETPLSPGQVDTCVKTLVCNFQKFTSALPKQNVIKISHKKCTKVHKSA